ncbi:MAG: amino acid permease [Gammaproteobacteria bacterium TMED182]|jgi:APA family basic amino acid/polyamine antiporter|nr:amino acid permease [Gammaproteobacteria bacterium]RPG56890.1 MAG: amino acid permease [Gammaproteobacteria bacterium TMED182]
MMCFNKLSEVILINHPEIETSSPPAPKALGFWRGWAIVVGGTIGSGIFMLPALLAPYGLMGFAGWFIAGCGALILTFMLSDLSRALPVIGGPYAYARAGMGDFIGFWIGWGYWIAIWAATAAISVACVGYLSFFFPQLATSAAGSAAVTLAIIWFLVLINSRSVAASGQVQLATTLLKILPLLLVGGLGIYGGTPDNLPSINPMGGSYFAAIATSVTLVMWAFVGLEGATVPAADMKDPERLIPKILLTGTLTVLAVYLIAYLGVILLLPADVLANSNAPFADASVAVLGRSGAGIIAAGAVMATFGALNTQILLSGQLVRAISLDGLFPGRLHRLNAGGTPASAMIVSGFLASLLVLMNYSKSLVEAFNMMILLSTLTTLIPLAFAAVTAMLLFRDQPGSRKKIVTAALAFLYALLVIIGAGAETVYYGFILLVAAMPCYALLKAQQAT